MARPVRWAAALLIAAMGTPNLAAGQTPLQDAASFWKSVEAIPASLLAPLKPFNLSASSGGQFWNPLQPKKNISSQPFSASQALAAPYANPNPDNGNPKWKLPVPLNGSHSLATAADNAPAVAPVPSMMVPLSEHAAPQPPVSGPKSAAALAEAVNLNPDNGNPKYKLPVPLNISNHLNAKADNATGPALVPNVTFPLSEHKNLTLPLVSGPSPAAANAEAAAAQAVREQQARLAAALAQAANGPAPAARLPNVTAHNSTIPGYYHPPTAALGPRNPELVSVQQPLSALFPTADHAEAPASAIPSQAAPSTDAAAFIHKVHPAMEAAAPIPATDTGNVRTRRQLLVQAPAPAA